MYLKNRQFFSEIRFAVKTTLMKLPKWIITYQKKYGIKFILFYKALKVCMFKMKKEHDASWKGYGMYCEQDANGVWYPLAMDIGVKFIDGTKLGLIAVYGVH
jgi:hypothetical protein